MKSTITFLAPVKNRQFLRFIHNNNNNNYHFHHQLLRMAFSEYTEAVTTSLIPIDAILPEICTFIVGFSCTAWTKMRSFRANQLIVLADAILIPPRPPIPPTSIIKVRGLRKSMKLETEKPFTSKRKKEM